MTKSTTATLIDEDGAILSLDGRPLRNPVRAGYPADIVEVSVGASESTSIRAWISARELVAAIEKVADLEPEPDRTPAASPELEPLWTEVRERPARAVKVTPELVRTLAGTREHAELAELKPKFSAATGEPKGVEFYDPRTANDVLAAIDTVVVLRQGQPPQRLIAEDFERTYEEVAT